MGVFEVGDSWIEVLMPKNGLKGSEGTRWVLRHSGRGERLLRRSGRGEEGPQAQWEGTGGSWDAVGGKGRILRCSGRGGEDPETSWEEQRATPFLLTPAVGAGFGDLGPMDKCDGLFSKKWQS